ncbi:MAG: HAD family hydrolase [Candidatus Hodarchaeota archaeon]
MSQHRFDLFFDLHGVLADLEIVSENYNDYLVRVLIPTGIKREEVSMIHRKAFVQWLEEIYDLSKTEEEIVFDPVEFINKYSTIDKKWENFILSNVPKHHRESIRPLLDTKRVEYEALAYGAPILYPEVQSVLEELKEISNLYMHIASSASSQHVKGAVDRHQLHFFQTLIGYDTVKAPKKEKNGRYFKEMLALTQANPKRSIFVGNSIEEAQLSLRFGMHFIMLDRESQINKIERNNLPYRVFDDLTEILPLIYLFLTTSN